MINMYMLDFGNPTDAIISSPPPLSLLLPY